MIKKGNSKVILRKKIQHLDFLVLFLSVNLSGCLHSCFFSFGVTWNNIAALKLVIIILLITRTIIIITTTTLTMLMIKLRNKQQQQQYLMPRLTHISKLSCA